MSGMRTLGILLVQPDPSVFSERGILSDVAKDRNIGETIIVLCKIIDRVYRMYQLGCNEY